MKNLRQLLQFLKDISIITYNLGSIDELFINIGQAEYILW